jgi:long-chain acyl-CoA synthetase
LNKNLSPIEKVKKYFITDNEFTIENRMLTPTLKLKRKEIVRNYLKEIENLY